eukprot:gb/GECG01003261.1/.p1 GENE.gb/GECG01003261.1/~~gb/GECG01003261.1/.p1  ORF type:complete len:108 (+),score=14.61 gb/GECG01003261.1/:1-324(+)
MNLRLSSSNLENGIFERFENAFRGKNFSKHESRESKEEMKTKLYIKQLYCSERRREVLEKQYGRAFSPNEDLIFDREYLRHRVEIVRFCGKIHNPEIRQNSVYILPP